MTTEPVNRGELTDVREAIADDPPHRFWASTACAGICRSAYGQAPPRSGHSSDERYRKRMGWQFTWVSSFGTGFNYDFRVSFTPDEVASRDIDYNFGDWRETGEEWPGVSAFYKNDTGEVFRAYSTYGRDVEVMMGTYNMLDLAPKGRNEAEGMDWVRRHDRYE